MALPTDFNSWEHLQDLLIKLVNPAVREEFQDAGDDTLTTPRATLKAACLMRDTDTSTVALIKLFLFYLIVKGDLEEIVSMISDLIYSENKGLKRKHRPKVTLYFRSKYSASENITWRSYSFRIMNETSETFSKSQALQLAQAIKTNFGNGDGFFWETGKEMYSYTEWDRGYQFQVLASTPENAKKVIKEMMSLQAHSPNWTYFNKIENDAPSETYPDNPPSLIIMGDSVEEPARRPRKLVYFSHATLSLPPRKPVVLFDRTGRRFNALVS